MIDDMQLVSMIKGIVSLSAGQLCTCLPPEIVAYIWSYLTLKDLVKFGHTSCQNYHLVCCAGKNTIYRLIALFRTKGGVDQFLYMMKTEQAVILWSMALWSATS